MWTLAVLVTVPRASKRDRLAVPFSSPLSATSRHVARGSRTRDPNEVKAALESGPPPGPRTETTHRAGNQKRPRNSGRKTRPLKSGLLEHGSQNFSWSALQSLLRRNQARSHLSGLAFDVAPNTATGHLCLRESGPLSGLDLRTANEPAFRIEDARGVTRRECSTST